MESVSMESVRMLDLDHSLDLDRSHNKFISNELKQSDQTWNVQYFFPVLFCNGRFQFRQWRMSRYEYDSKSLSRLSITDNYKNNYFLL